MFAFSLVQCERAALKEKVIIQTLFIIQYMQMQVSAHSRSLMSFFLTMTFSKTILYSLRSYKRFPNARFYPSSIAKHLQIGVFRNVKRNLSVLMFKCLKCGFGFERTRK